jgi:hypothetical protein
MELDDHENAFSKMCEAFELGQICMVECREAETGENVAVVCAIIMENGTETYVPLARMFNQDPFEELLPPDGAEVVEVGADCENEIQDTNRKAKIINLVTKKSRSQMVH